MSKDSFLCAALGTRLSVAFTRKLGAGFFGGEGFILQKLNGSGMAFVHAGGTVIKKELNGETLKVDTGCIVGFTSGIEYDIERAGNLKSMVFGGEGLFLATLKERELFIYKVYLSLVWRIVFIRRCPSRVVIEESSNPQQLHSTVE